MIISLNPQAGIPAKYANRHALVTGATGTGKTVTLQKLIEGFSNAGIPVYCADVKGDLSALARSCPARFLDVYGQQGARLQVPVWAMGADLLARALELTEAQAGSLEIAFAHADARSLPLDTLNDLRAVFAAMAMARESICATIGHFTMASIGTIQRALLRLENQGAGQFFGAPAFDIASLLDHDLPLDGPALGLVSILAAEKLLHAPRLYSALMLWLLRELSQRLPELGDMEKPRLIFVFDEAHTLFSDCPAPLLRSIEQTARLIRSKGVGLYFASQSPDDIPLVIRDQLATRVEHDRTLGVGRAHFVTLSANGQPTPRMLIKPDLPACPLGALEQSERPARQPEITRENQPPTPSTDMTWHGYAFLAVAACALAGLFTGIMWAWNAGTFGAIVAGLIGAALALKRIAPG